MSDKKDCIFCKIIKGEIPCYKVYEDEDFFAMLDIHPVNPGHLLLMPKKHSDTFLETDDKIIEKIFVVAKKLAESISRPLKTNDFSFTINNGELAGQIVQHLHIHIIPRFKEDNFINWPNKALSDEEMKKITEKIKNSLKEKTTQF